jgi:hypothetical protein
MAAGGQPMPLLSDLLKVSLGRLAAQGETVTVRSGLDQRLEGDGLHDHIRHHAPAASDELIGDRLSEWLRDVDERRLAHPAIEIHHLVHRVRHRQPRVAQWQSRVGTAGEALRRPQPPVAEAGNGGRGPGLERGKFERLDVRGLCHGILSCISHACSS